MNIVFMTHLLNMCSVRWSPLPGVSYFFYMETLVKKDIGGIHQNLLCQSNIELTSGRKRNERHQSLFNDALVVSSNLLFCATCIPYYERLHFNQAFCTKLKYSFLFFFFFKFILTSLLTDCNFLFLYCVWGLADTPLYISQLILRKVSNTFKKNELFTVPSFQLNLGTNNNLKRRQILLILFCCRC